MKRKAPGGAGQWRRGMKPKCENSLFNIKNFPVYQALCRPIFFCRPSWTVKAGGGAIRFMSAW